MKYIWIFLLTFAALSCSPPTEPVPFISHITAYVHWEDQPLEGKKIELVQSGETKTTASDGKVEFTVIAGKYIIRAYDINRGGPSYRILDFEVEVKVGETATVDIVDCLPCL